MLCPVEVSLPHLLVGDKCGDTVLRAIRLAVDDSARTIERLVIRVHINAL